MLLIELWSKYINVTLIIYLNITCDLGKIVPICFRIADNVQDIKFAD